MRALVLLVVFLLILLLLYLVTSPLREDMRQRKEIRRQARAARTARWEIHTESRRGVTTVLLLQLDERDLELNRQVIGTIADDADDWQGRYLELEAEAMNRLATLQTRPIPLTGEDQ